MNEILLILSATEFFPELKLVFTLNNSKQNFVWCFGGTQGLIFQRYSIQFQLQYFTLNLVIELKERKTAYRGAFKKGRGYIYILHLLMSVLVPDSVHIQRFSVLFTYVCVVLDLCSSHRGARIFQYVEYCILDLFISQAARIFYKT